MYVLRTPDGRVASAKRYAKYIPARGAANRIARRIGGAVQVWWTNDAGIPKLLEYTANPGKES